jgi:hypothetical protein
MTLPNSNNATLQLEAGGEFPAEPEDYVGDEDSFAIAMEAYVDDQKDAYGTLVRALRGAEMRDLNARTAEGIRTP